MKKILRLLLIGTIVIPINTKALKKETVYTNLDINGNVNKTTVNSHIYNKENITIKEKTLLENVFNVNSDEKIKIDNGILSIDAKGKDIYYKGLTKKESIISIHNTYYLNDKKIDPKDNIGKKGNVRIEIELKNNLYNDKTKIYNPVVVTLGTILSNKDNSNISITNGKSIDTGTNNLLISLASPGLYESTKIDEFKDLDKVVIEYETSNFSLNNIYFIATPKLLSNDDFKIFDKVDSLNSSVALISKNMDKIDEGAQELKKGTNSLKNGTNEISTNLNKTLLAIESLESGSSKLNSGINEIILNLNKTKEMLNNKDINGSLEQLKILKGKNNEAINSLTLTNNSIKATYETYKLNEFSIESLNEYLVNLGLDNNTISNIITCKKTYEGNLNLITLLNYNNNSIDSTISSLTEILNNINTLIDTLNNALTIVGNGTKELNNGLTLLKGGVNKLYNGSVELNNGVNKLDVGVNTLSDGISTLNNKGIKVLNGYSNKLKNYSDSLKKLKNESLNYKGFVSDNSNSTIFIYKMESLEK